MKLIRVSYSKNAVFGVFLNELDMPFAVTAEPPWRDNMVGLSCIPTGEYICKRTVSPHFGETFEVTGVPGRTHILFHKGNIPLQDSKGCILLGEQFEPPGIQHSGHGFGEFMGLTKGEDSFTLTII